MHIDAKVMQGFGGAGVLEVVENFMGDTYRAVYTVKFEEAVYVLHSFQKKSKKNDETPRQDVETIKRRLRWAQAEHDAWMKEQGRKNGHAKGRRGDTGATP